MIKPLCKYTYDALYRLKQATGRELNGLVKSNDSDCPIQNPVPDTETNACRNYTLNYDYDELGNILKIQHIAQDGNWTRNYFYLSNSNKLIGHTSGQTDYTYDASGNMLSMPHLNEMGWDEDDMLIEADLGGGGTAYYRYDSQRQRVRKVIVNGNVKKERLYINDFELWQQSTSGTVQTERETLSIADDQKSFLQLETLTIENGNTFITPSTNWRYQYDNHLGSACLELDDSAAVISYEEYYPFGVTSYRSGKSQSEVKLKKYRYCGKERDEETGLYYYGARYYAAWIGRFISIDPLAEKFPQLTPYNYAGNKCITHKDLEGLQSTDDNEEDVNENNKNEPPKETESNYSEMLDEIVIYFSRLSSEVSETIQSDINRSDKDWERMKKDFKPISEFIGKFLNFEPRGGIVGYADNNFTQDGIAEPNKAKAGDDVTYVDLTGLQVAAVIYGPQQKGKVPEGAKIVKDLLSTFLEPIEETSKNFNTPAKTDSSKNNLENIKLEIVESWSVGTPFGNYSEGGVITIKDTAVAPSIKKKVLRRMDSINNLIKQKAREKFKNKL